MSDCEFCDLEGFRLSDLFAEDDHCLFAAGAPGWREDLLGNGIIVPKLHRPTPFDLTDDEVRSTHQLLGVARSLLDERHRPSGYTVGWNVGRTAGQLVDHAHLHVIPRYPGDGADGLGIRGLLRRAR